MEMFACSPSVNSVDTVQTNSVKKSRDVTRMSLSFLC